MEQEQRIATLERLLLAAVAGERRAQSAAQMTGSPAVDGATVLASLRRISLRWRSGVAARALDGWLAAASAAADLARDVEVSVTALSCRGCKVVSKPSYSSSSAYVAYLTCILFLAQVSARARRTVLRGWQSASILKKNLRSEFACQLMGGWSCWAVH